MRSASSSRAQQCAGADADTQRAQCDSDATEPRAVLSSSESSDCAHAVLGSGRITVVSVAVGGFGTERHGRCRLVGLGFTFDGGLIPGRRPRRRNRSGWSGIRRSPAREADPPTAGTAMNSPGLMPGLPSDRPPGHGRGLFGGGVLGDLGRPSRNGLGAGRFQVGQGHAHRDGVGGVGFVRDPER